MRSVEEILEEMEELDKKNSELINQLNNLK